MQIDHIRPKTIEGIKSLAKQIKKRDCVRHSEALERAAEQAGFASYHQALATLSESETGPYALSEQ